MNKPKCKCGEPVEWADEYCQRCWEDYCSGTWWEMMMYKGLLVQQLGVEKI
jgi:hypothetical protein